MDFLIVLYLILSSGTIIFGQNETLIVGGFTLLIILYQVAYKKKITLSSQSFEILFILILIILISYLINNPDLSKHSINFVSGFILKIINAFLFVNCIEFNKFRIIYIQIIVVLTFISLIFYFGFKFNFTWFNNFPALSQSTEYVNYLIYVHYPALYGLKYRNASIFNEPAVFQGLVNLGILFVITDDEKKSKRHIFFHINIKKLSLLIIFILAVFTTFSTTGYIALVLNIIIIMLRRIKYIIFLPVTAVLVGFILSTTYFQNVIDKKLSDSKNYSTERRMTDIKIEMEMFLKKPILGYGYSFFSEKEQNLKVSGIKEQWTGSTNSITYHMALFGAIFIIFILWGYGILTKTISDNILQGVFIFLLFIIILFGYTLLQKMLFLAIGFYGFSLRRIYSDHL